MTMIGFKTDLGKRSARSWRRRGAGGGRGEGDVPTCSSLINNNNISLANNDISPASIDISLANNNISLATNNDISLVNNNTSLANNDISL